MVFFSMQRVSQPHLKAGKCLLTTTLLLISLVGFAGCMRSDEKTFAGTARGEFPLHYDLTMTLGQDNKVAYTLKITPNNGNEFLSHLNKKWHDEASLKYSAYDKLKEYCDQYKDVALCFNYDELKKEVESKEVTVFYAITLYDNGKKELDNISGKFSFDLNNKEILQDNWMNVTGSVTMTQAQFRNIAVVELQTK